MTVSGQLSSDVQRADFPEGDGDDRLAQRLTPDAVRRFDFPRTPIGRRGYNEADVERFRARVVHEIGQSNAEKAALRTELQRQREEVRRLRDYYRVHRVDVDGADRQQAGAPSTQINVNIATAQAVNVMSQAQQAADQHIAQAEDYARRLVANARLQYEEILQRAHEQAQQAATEAGRLYEARAARPDADEHEDPEQMQYLQSRLAYMRTFAQVTQVQLRSILDALRKELDNLTELPTEVPAGAGTPVAPGGGVPAGLPGSSSTAAVVVNGGKGLSRRR
jgi:cell division initiation protein